MDNRDQELLAKQVGRINGPVLNETAILLVLVAVFFAGMTTGGYLFADKGAPVVIASSDSPAASSHAVALPIAR